MSAAARSAVPLRLLIAGRLPAAALPAALRQTGFTVLDCEAEDAVQSVRLDKPDVVLLDPSRADSWRAARALRRAGLDVGLVLLTGATVACPQAETWLDEADALLTGPVPPRSLAAHCRAVDRRRRGHATAQFLVRGVGIDPGTGEVLVDDRRVAMSASQRTLLVTLLRRPGTTVSRDTLMNALYGDDDACDAKIIDVMMCKVRRQLTAAGAPPDLIETIWGQGYLVRREAAGAPVARRAA